MRRRRRIHDDHENHERWLVSYADFITLLFAFFVVMYAISTINQNKYRVLSDTLGNVFGQPDAVDAAGTVKGQQSAPVTTTVAKAVSPNPQHTLQQETKRMTVIARNLSTVLASLVKQGQVSVTQSEHGVSIQINASVLFASGEAILNKDSTQALNAIANVLKNDMHLIQIEGYTDNAPIVTTQFASNWELSAVRASSVARLFEQAGVDAARLTVLGHAANQAVADNDTAQGRAKNRRVGIMILSDLPVEDKEVKVEE